MDLVTYLANLIEYSNLLYIIEIRPSRREGVERTRSESVECRNELYGYFQDSNGLVIFICFFL